MEIVKKIWKNQKISTNLNFRGHVIQALVPLMGIKNYNYNYNHIPSPNYERNISTIRNLIQAK